MNIKELAKQAGISFGGHPMNPLSVYFSELTRFAELVAAAEREKCARLCEPQEDHDDPLTAWNIAQLIKARGDTK